MFTKLRSRLTVIFAALTIIPLIAVTAVFGTRSYNQLFANSIHDQSVLAERFSVAIQNAIFSRIDNLTFINDTFGIRQLTLPQQRDLLNDLLSKGQEYNQIALLDAQGMELARVSRLGVVTDAELADRSQDPLFLESLGTQETRFSDVHFDSQTGEPLLSIAVPYFDLRTGYPNYVIVADFRLRTTWNLISTLEQQLGNVASPNIFVIDSSGQVIAHANASVVLQHTIYHAPAENGQGVNLNGEPAIITTQPLVLGNKEFVLVGEQPLSEALRPAAAIRALPQFAAIPIIAISAMDPAIALPQVRRKGFNGFIAKPIDTETFPNHVAQVLAGEHVWDVDGMTSIESIWCMRQEWRTI